MAGEESGIDAFLSQRLTARIATNGPAVRPMWFLREDQAFWILTGPVGKIAAAGTGGPRNSPRGR